MLRYRVRVHFCVRELRLVALEVDLEISPRRESASAYIAFERFLPWKIEKIKLATSQENMSSGFATRQDSNWPAQIHRLASLEILHASSMPVGIILSRLRGCAGWSASLLFAYEISRFSHDVAHYLFLVCFFLYIYFCLYSFCFN